MKIINLTPHPVTIIRHGAPTPGMLQIDGAAVTGESIPDPHGAPADRLEVTRLVFPACDQTALPRATEERIGHAGCMELSVSGDTQDAYSNAVAMRDSGVVDYVTLSGVEALPEISAADRAFGCTTWYIVSITTAIGALAAGRPIVDLLVPAGQVRDAQGRVCGATGLAPASSLLTPIAERLLGWGRKQGRTWHAEADVGRPVRTHGGRHVCAVLTSTAFDALRDTLDAREETASAAIDGVASQSHTAALDDIARVRLELGLEGRA